MTENKYTKQYNELVDISIRYKVSFVLTQLILNELAINGIYYATLKGSINYHRTSL